MSATLEDFFREVWSGRDLANQAVAILVFPTIVKAGFGVGGEYGKGALHIRGRTAGYYNIISASIGFQFGARAVCATAQPHQALSIRSISFFMDFLRAMSDHRGPR